MRGTAPYLVDRRDQNDYDQRTARPLPSRDLTKTVGIDTGDLFPLIDRPPMPLYRFPPLVKGDLVGGPLPCPLPNPRNPASESARWSVEILSRETESSTFSQMTQTEFEDRDSPSALTLIAAIGVVAVLDETDMWLHWPRTVRSGWRDYNWIITRPSPHLKGRRLPVRPVHPSTSAPRTFSGKPKPPEPAPVRTRSRSRHRSNSKRQDTKAGAFMLTGAVFLIGIILADYHTFKIPTLSSAKVELNHHWDVPFMDRREVNGSDSLAVAQIFVSPLLSPD